MPNKILVANKKQSNSPLLTLVRHDARSQIIEFEVDKTFGGVNLENLTWCVNFLNAKQEFDTSICGKAKMVTDTTVIVEWLVPALACAEEGYTVFELEGLAEDDEGQHVVWQSASRTIKVLPDVDGEPVYEEQTLSEIQRFIIQVGEELPTVYAARDAALAAAQDATKTVEKVEEALSSVTTAYDRLKEFSDALDTTVGQKLADIGQAANLHMNSIISAGAQQVEAINGAATGHISEIDAAASAGLSQINNKIQNVVEDVEAQGGAEIGRIETVSAQQVKDIREAAAAELNAVIGAGTTQTGLVNAEGIAQIATIRNVASDESSELTNIAEQYVQRAETARDEAVKAKTDIEGVQSAVNAYKTVIEDYTVTVVTAKDTVLASEEAVLQAKGEVETAASAVASDKQDVEDIKSDVQSIADEAANALEDIKDQFVDAVRVDNDAVPNTYVFPSIEEFDELVQRLVAIESGGGAGLKLYHDENGYYIDDTPPSPEATVFMALNNQPYNSSGMVDFGDAIYGTNDLGTGQSKYNYTIIGE